MRGSRGELLLPERAPTGPELEVRLVDADAEVAALCLDERLWVEPTVQRSPPPRIEIVDPGSVWIEVLLATDLGHQSAPVARFAETGAASLREILLSPVGSGGILLWQALAQSADLGSTRAFLELRAHASAEAALAGATPAAVSRWIALEWNSSLREKMFEKRE
jgi:hypothetical protein